VGLVVSIIVPTSSQLYVNYCTFAYDVNQKYTFAMKLQHTVHAICVRNCLDRVLNCRRYVETLLLPHIVNSMLYALHVYIDIHA